MWFCRKKENVVDVNDEQPKIKEIKILRTVLFQHNENRSHLYFESNNEFGLDFEYYKDKNVFLVYQRLNHKESSYIISVITNGYSLIKTDYIFKTIEI